MFLVGRHRVRLTRGWARNPNRRGGRDGWQRRRRLQGRRIEREDWLQPAPPGPQPAVRSGPSQLHQRRRVEQPQVVAADLDHALTAETANQPGQGLGRDHQLRSNIPFALVQPDDGLPLGASPQLATLVQPLGQPGRRILSTRPVPAALLWINGKRAPTSCLGKFRANRAIAAKFRACVSPNATHVQRQRNLWPQSLTEAIFGTVRRTYRPVLGSHRPADCRHGEQDRLPVSD